MEETIVQVQGLKYGRTGYIKIVGDAIIFDTSEEEYGCMSVSLTHLKAKIEEHKTKMSDNQRVTLKENK